jgi:hypothetical protein
MRCQLYDIFTQNPREKAVQYNVFSAGADRGANRGAQTRDILRYRSSSTAVHARAPTRRRDPGRPRPYGEPAGRLGGPGGHILANQQILAAAGQNLRLQQSRARSAQWKREATMAVERWVQLRFSTSKLLSTQQTGSLQLSHPC